MNPEAFLVKNIWQHDNHNFCVEWSNGKTITYTLGSLQRQCPCAGCVDETTGERLIPEETIPDDVRAIRISSVGHYALKIQFATGCSNGIYNFDLLRDLGEEV